MCRGDGKNAAIGIELHAVDAHLAVDAGSLFPVDEGGVDAVINHIPLIAAGDLKDAVMRRTKDVLVGTLLKDNGLCRHLDGTER